VKKFDYSILIVNVKYIKSRHPDGQECVKGLYAGQLVVESAAGGYLMADESVCLDAPQWRDPDAGVRFMACAELERQLWQLSREADAPLTARIVHAESGLCLAATQAATSDPLTLVACSGRADQLWRLREEEWTDKT